MRNNLILFLRCAAYFSAYAYVYIGLYGSCLLTSGSKVGTLFLNNGVSIAVVDAMASVVLSLANVSLGLFCSMFGMYIYPQP